MSSLDAFFRATIGERPPPTVGGDWESLDNHPDFHAPVLAALGRLEDASTVALSFVEANEARWRRDLADGQTLIAGHVRRGIGRDMVDFATQQLVLLSDIKTLGQFAERGDRSGVVALLRDWERQKMRSWGLDDIWEPTPFPLEL